MKFPESARDVIEMLADEGTFAAGECPAVREDPIGWTEPASYVSKLKEARRKTGLSCAVLWGKACVRRMPAILAASDWRFQGGSIGTAEAAALARCFETAASEHLPVIWVVRGGGARVQEGTFSLAAVARVLAARNGLAEHGVPLITVAADPLAGGCTICAMQGDAVLALEGAFIGFAGPKVIEMYTKEPMPEGFQTAQYALATGQVDAVLAVEDLQSSLVSLLGTLAPSQPMGAGTVAAGEADAGAEHVDPWVLVQQARGDDRPSTRDVVAGAFDAFFELRGDRVSGDDPAMLCGLARLAGEPVVIIAHDAMRETEEKVRHNFAMVHPAGHRKALRLVRLAERLRLPIITLVDTPGACPDVRAESEGQGGIMGQLLCELLAAKVPTVSVILGQGSSGGAMVLATADHVTMTDQSYYSVISPEAAAAILWKDPQKVAEAAAGLQLTPAQLRQAGLVDGVVAMGPSGDKAGDVVRDAIVAGLARARNEGGRRVRLGDKQ